MQGSNQTIPTPETNEAPAWTSDDLQADPHRNPEKARRVEQMFASIASSYDLNNRLHSFWRDQAWRRKAVRLVKAGSDDDVLDVACGTGDLSEAFARAGAKSVTGLDFTAAMLDVARHKADRLSDRVTIVPSYIQGDAMALPFEDDSFDILSIAFGIRNVAEPARALAEFRRVLRPSGRLVILEFSEPRNPILRWGNNLYTKRIMPWTATVIARDRSGAYRYLPKSVSTFFKRDEMEQAMGEAGFEEVRHVPMTFGVCVAYLGRCCAAEGADNRA